MDTFLDMLGFRSERSLTSQGQWSINVKTCMIRYGHCVSVLRISATAEIVLCNLEHFSSFPKLSHSQRMKVVCTGM